MRILFIFWWSLGYNLIVTIGGDVHDFEDDLMLMVVGLTATVDAGSVMSGD